MSGPAPGLMAYDQFARMIYQTAILSDPWLGGEERFSLRGSILSSAQAEALSLAAERVGWIYHEVAEIVRRHPELLDDFFGLTPYQKAMWLAARGRWHGIARVDLFLCADGQVRTCEMNSDTPSGEAETVLLNQLLHSLHPGTRDPNADFPRRFLELLEASHRARLAAVGPESDGPNLAVGIIYPTDLPEDLSMIAIYRRWLEEAGHRVILGSPFNLGLDLKRRVTLFGEPVDLVIRHYKTDWWGEREPIWFNQAPFNDPEPLDRELRLMLAAEDENRVTIVNPFGSVLTQNKKAMALMTERRDLFSDQARKWIDEYVPPTRRVESIESDLLDRREWVLKSDYGCEGDSVICGPFVSKRDWKVALAALIPARWVAQRFFEVAPDEEGQLPNYGVYLLGGRAAGFYTRRSNQSTDYTALTAPTFIRPD
jgi:glutathionylspermidine synthase